MLLAPQPEKDVADGGGADDDVDGDDDDDADGVDGDDDDDDVADADGDDDDLVCSNKSIRVRGDKAKKSIPHLIYIFNLS